MNWKNPIVTGGFLLFLNLAYMIYLYLDVSILTVATYKVLLYTAFCVVRRKYTGEDCKYYIIKKEPVPSLKRATLSVFTHFYTITLTYYSTNLEK
jgi:hypothetical protein